jgi:hypothetical protein
MRMCEPDHDNDDARNGLRHQLTVNGVSPVVSNPDGDMWPE